MQSTIVTKAEKAHRYAQEPDRLHITALEATFEAGGGTHVIGLRDGAWTCDCDFFRTSGVCPHVEARIADAGRPSAGQREAARGGSPRRFLIAEPDRAAVPPGHRARRHRARGPAARRPGPGGGHRRPLGRGPARRDQPRVRDLDRCLPRRAHQLHFNGHRRPIDLHRHGGARPLRRHHVPARRDGGHVPRSRAER